MAKTASKRDETAPPMVRAKARYVRVAPRKARLVADQIRGMPVDEALSLLQFAPQAAAETVGKVLASAVANAETTEGLDAADLVVAAATVDEGPTMKRWRARAQGRASRINKRTSHITIVVAPADSLATKNDNRTKKGRKA